MNKYPLSRFNGIILIAGILLSTFMQALAQVKTNPGNDKLHSPSSTLKFADYLYCQKDYLRAVTEYENYLSFSASDTVKYKIALSFLKMARFTEAEDRFRSLLPGSSLKDEAKLGLFETKFFSSNMGQLRELYRESDFHPVKYADPVRSLYYLTFLYGNAPLPAEEEFTLAFPAHSRDEMKNFYNRKAAPGYKSSLKAALLSALIPGLGKVYTGEYGDGITAFIVSGLLSYLTYDNFIAHHYFRGYTFAGLAALFYAGNIYGSAAQAQIYNAGIDFTFTTDLNLFLNRHNHFLPDDEPNCK